MRNRALHGALRDFALEAAALLTDDLRAGAEVEFDVIDQAGRRGPALYRYQPRTGRVPRGALAAPARARHLRGGRRASSAAGAALWLRVNGARRLSGEQAEPALQAMLERLYEDATSFGFPEERFERVYREVEATLYRDALAARVVAPLRGVAIEADRSTWAAACRSCAARRRRAGRGRLARERRRRAGRAVRARARRDRRGRDHGGRGRGALHAAW